MERYNWSQINNDEQLTQLGQSILNDNPKIVGLYKAGKKKVFRVLMREAQMRSESRANMTKMNQILLKLLE